MNVKGLTGKGQALRKAGDNISSWKTLIPFRSYGAVGQRKWDEIINFQN